MGCRSGHWKHRQVPWIATLQQSTEFDLNGPFAESSSPFARARYLGERPPNTPCHLRGERNFGIQRF